MITDGIKASSYIGGLIETAVEGVSTEDRLNLLNIPEKEFSMAMIRLLSCVPITQLLEYSSLAQCPHSEDALNKYKTLKAIAFTLKE